MLVRNNGTSFNFTKFDPFYKESFQGKVQGINGNHQTLDWSILSTQFASVNFCSAYSLWHCMYYRDLTFHSAMKDDSLLKSARKTLYNCSPIPESLLSKSLSILIICKCPGTEVIKTLLFNKSTNSKACALSIKMILIAYLNSAHFSSYWLHIHTKNVHIHHRRLRVPQALLVLDLHVMRVSPAPSGVYYHSEGKLYPWPEISP